MDELTLARLKKQREESIAQGFVAPEKFLVAWKKAVKLAGARLFTNHHNYPAVESVNDAINKWQLIPNYEVIKEFMGYASTGERLFVAVLYSFYNSDDGAEFCEELGFRGIGDMANRLELDQLKIIIELMCNHTGW